MKTKATATHAVWNVQSTGNLDIIPAQYGSAVKIGQMDSVKSIPMFRGTLEECQQYIKTN